MVTVNTHSLTVPVGIIRLFEFVLTLITFSLVASEGHNSNSFWAWCMFTWCFCCFTTLLIIIMEFTDLNTKIPISWDDFTTAFAMLSTLMLLAASVIYPTFFVCSSCSIRIAATVISCVCFCLYAAEVGLTRAKPGEISGFLSTVPGLLKVLEAFVACIIFICLDSGFYGNKPGLQWCVAVYSICFIIALLIIILTIGRLLGRCPFPLDKCMTGYNILAILMYITAMVIWPIYSFDENPRPPICQHCPWDSLVVVSCMTCINLIVYIVPSFALYHTPFFSLPVSCPSSLSPFLSLDHLNVHNSTKASVCQLQNHLCTLGFPALFRSQGLGSAPVIFEVYLFSGPIRATKPCKIV